MSEETTQEAFEDGPYHQLAALFGARHQVCLSVGTIEIEPMTLRRFPTFMQWYARADFSGEEIGPEAEEANARVFEMLTGCSHDWLSALPEDDLKQVVMHVFEANPTLFKKNGAEGGPASIGGIDVREQEKALCVAVAQLIEAGHRLRDIEGYTLHQFEILSRAHARLAAERQINSLVAARGGQVEVKSFQQIIGQLQKDIASL